MKRNGMLALALVVVGACDNDTTQPSNVNSPTVVFTAQMTAANEVPPITGTEANARGDVRISLDVVRDGNGVITSGTASFIINLSGFPAGTTAVAAHVHEGAPGVAGGIRIGIPSSMLSATAPISMPNGTATNVTYNAVPLDAVGLAAANAMLNNPNGYYFNVHTPTNPGGAVRGPLVKQ